MDMKTVQTLTHYVGGRRVEAKGGRFGDVYNPALGAVAAKVPLASSDEVNSAIQVAKSAFPDWAATPPAARAKILFNFREQIICPSRRMHKTLVGRLPHGPRATANRLNLAG